MLIVCFEVSGDVVSHDAEDVWSGEDHVESRYWVRVV